MVDPADGVAVGDALLAFVRTELADPTIELAAPPLAPDTGMSTFIWFFALRGNDLPAHWRPELVLRLHAHTDEADVARREAAIQTFVAGHGYPAPATVAIRADPHAEANPFGLPFMVMPRAEGRPMLALVTARPWTVPSLLRSMADLQLRLHALPVDGCPLPYDQPLVDTALDRLDAMAERGGWTHLGETRQWLRANAGAVRQEEPVLAHGDFHPLNIIAADDGTMTLIDWTDAVLGDRHFDAARTIALFWAASVAATSWAERLALTTARGWLARTYQRAYEVGFPLDPRRLTYWQVVHLFRGQMQVLELHQPVAEGQQRTSAAQDVPLDLADRLGHRVAMMRSRFDAQVR